MTRRARPEPDSFLSNLGAGSYNPLQRVGLVFSNVWKKRGGQGCCGNYGEPGC